MSTGHITETDFRLALWDAYCIGRTDRTRDWPHRSFDELVAAINAEQAFYPITSELGIRWWTPCIAIAEHEAAA